MKIVLDTNIVMDALQERQPFDGAAKRLLLQAQHGAVTCMLTANAITDIYYLYSRARDCQAARQAVDFLLRHYIVVAITQEDCVAALQVGLDDYEDALLVVCADKAAADYIVTRDEALHKAQTPVATIQPDEILTLLGFAPNQ